MKLPQKLKISTASKVFFPFVICLLIYCQCFAVPQSCFVFAKSSSKTKSKRHAHAIKQKHNAQEDAEALEKAAREAHEAKLNEGKNLTLAKAYRLYDSGTSENLQGNYKYSILQLKLADELLQEHGQANTSLAMATLMALVSSAQGAHDYSLAKSTCERLLSNHPQDIQILLTLTKIEMAQGNYHAAAGDINNVLDSAPNNVEAKFLNETIINKLKPVKRQ